MRTKERCSGRCEASPAELVRSNKNPYPNPGDPMLKRINEVEIPEEGDPFANDLLDRRTIANNLTALLENTTTPYVMSISAPWGQGKTTFIKMWKKLLDQRGFGTVYFDAWSTDYADDPLLAFINAIDSAIEDKEDSTAKKAMGKVKSTFKRVIRASPKIALNWALRGGLNLITDGDEDPEDEINAITQIAEKLIEQEMAKFSATRQILDEFGEKLSELGKVMGNDDKPLVIFVDELDRCRPDYAVELLERIKHLFAVENVLVVLSVDTEKLGHAASQVIGFSPEDTDGYLRRFIDLDYRLPQASLVKLIRAHIDALELPAAYRQEQTTNNMASLAKLRHLSARDCLQIIHRFAATAKSFPDIREEYALFLPVVILDAYHNHQKLELLMNDSKEASTHIAELKGWLAEANEENDYDEWWARRNIFRMYAGWLSDLQSGQLDAEEGKEASHWITGLTRRSRNLSRHRTDLLNMNQYAESFR